MNNNMDYEKLPTLVLERHPGEGIIIGGCVRVSYTFVGTKKIKVCVQAPINIKVMREEIAGPIKEPT